MNWFVDLVACAYCPKTIRDGSLCGCIADALRRSPCAAARSAPDITITIAPWASNVTARG